MTCAEARELMLEADLIELRGEGPSALAQHLAACADCGTAAQRILDTTRLLDAALDVRASRRARRIPVAPLAAAAAALLLFAVLRSRQDGGWREPRPAASAASLANGVEVSFGRGRNAAVFKTKDPNITVVWFF